MVYKTLIQERIAKGIEDVTISHIDQISPFPYDPMRFGYLICHSHVSILPPTLTGIPTWIIFGAKFPVLCLIRMEEEL